MKCLSYLITCNGQTGKCDLRGKPLISLHVMAESQMIFDKASQRGASWSNNIRGFSGIQSAVGANQLARDCGSSDFVLADYQLWLFMAKTVALFSLYSWYIFPNAESSRLSLPFLAPLHKTTTTIRQPSSRVKKRQARLTNTSTSAAPGETCLHDLWKCK